jgi:hypothetical protein
MKSATTRNRNQRRRQNRSRKSIGGSSSGGDHHLNVYKSKNISTQQNTDPSYAEVGIVHVSDSTGISIVRDFATGVANMIGKKGFDNGPIQQLRNKTLKTINEILSEQTSQSGKDCKICNLRMEIDQTQPGLIYHHVSGTLLEKRDK